MPTLFEHAGGEDLHPLREVPRWDVGRRRLIRRTATPASRA